MNGQYNFTFDYAGIEPYGGGSLGPREGFMWLAVNGVFMLQNNRGETGYVRCVRDLQ